MRGKRKAVDSSWYYLRISGALGKFSKVAIDFVTSSATIMTLITGTLAQQDRTHLHPFSHQDGRLQFDALSDMPRPIPVSVQLASHSPQLTSSTAIRAPPN